MDQDLKQRLIGAAVITALAAIFVPMLFDDPIDESGKTINQLKIPEIPVKAQDVEIMPLPEKVEDVATRMPLEKPAQPQADQPYPAEEEAEIDIFSGSDSTIAENDIAVERGKIIEPDVDDRQAVATAQSQTFTAAGNKRSEAEYASSSGKAPSADTVAKTLPPAQKATVRWYLNAGSFSKKSNALAMLENLKKQGFTVSLKEAVNAKGPIYKVRVGPMLDKAKAQEVKARLMRINVNSFVSGD